MEQIKAYETTDGTKFFDKEEAEHYEDILAATPVDTGYRPAVGETCEFWLDDYGWRECYIVGLDAGECGYVVQSYEELFFECDTIFRKI